MFDENVVSFSKKTNLQHSGYPYIFQSFSSIDHQWIHRLNDFRSEQSIQMVIWNVLDDVEFKRSNEEIKQIKKKVIMIIANKTIDWYKNGPVNCLNLFEKLYSKIFKQLMDEWNQKQDERYFNDFEYDYIIHNYKTKKKRKLNNPKPIKINYDFIYDVYHDDPVETINDFIELEDLLFSYDELCNSKNCFD